MSDSDNVNLKKGALGVVGAAAMGAVMMSPALGIYACFGPMALTAGKAVPFVFILALLCTLPTAICYGLISKEIPSSGSAYTWLWEAVNPFVGVWIGCILALYFIIVVFLQPLLCGLFFNDLLRFVGINADFYTFIAGVVFSTIAVALITYKGIEVNEKGSVIDLIIQMLVVAALAVTIVIVLAGEKASRSYPVSSFKFASGSFRNIIRAYFWYSFVLRVQCNKQSCRGNKEPQRICYKGNGSCMCCAGIVLDYYIMGICNGCANPADNRLCQIRYNPVDTYCKAILGFGRYPDYRYRNDSGSRCLYGNSSRRIEDTVCYGKGWLHFKSIRQT